MKADRDEIERAIAHQRKMLRVLRGRLEQRELQGAQYGINVQPEVITEIHELTERLQRHEAELARLQTEAAADTEPVAEVEYRALLAEVWAHGQPSVAAAARLDWTRVRLGISPERSREIETEIREALAAEIFDTIPTDLFEYQISHGRFADGYQTECHFDTIYGGSLLGLLGRALCFSPSTALRLFMLRLPSDPPDKRMYVLTREQYQQVQKEGLPALEQAELVNVHRKPYLELNKFARELLHVNGVWPRQAKYALFRQFLTDLKAELASRQAAEGTDKV